MTPAVFLDRDNTLIANDGDLGDPDAVELLPGVPEGLGRLREAGYRLIVVTNQGGVARGRYGEDDVDAVNQRIARIVDERAGAARLIERFYYCPFHPDATVEAYRREHPWRKPQPGMLLQATRDLGLDLARSWMIGDAARDVAAGRSAGCRTILLAESEPGDGDARPTAVVPTFADAVDRILDDPWPRDEPGAPAETPATPPDPDPAITPTGLAQTDENELGRLRRAILALADELQNERIRRGEFTPLRMTALLCQLAVLLVALLGLLQVGTTEVFTKWMLGALLLQGVTIAILLLDLRG
jgi:D-glycero-D-manno-heptose 1,7-bisphosphate phosphatase